MINLRRVLGSLACLTVSLLVLDVGFAFFVTDPIVAVDGDWRGAAAFFALVDLVAIPVITFGGFLGLIILERNRKNGRTARLSWIVPVGALSGAIYGSLALLVIFIPDAALSIGIGYGGFVGALSGATWWWIVERPRSA